MYIFVEIITLVLGFVLLIKCTDLFVDCLSSIAINFNMSKMAIALTIAAFGTCIPELAISFHSISANNGSMAISNILGSNVINILLIIGLACTFYPVKIKSDTIKKEVPYLLAITTVFAFQLINNIYFARDNIVLTRVNGILLLLIFMLFVNYTIQLIKKSHKSFIKEKPKYSLAISIILSILSMLGIIYGSDIVVDLSTEIARNLKVSEKLITMTIIVIGTSLPEMIMTIVSAKKKEFDMSIGNIIGTNIFNIGIVLGLPITFYGQISSVDFCVVDVLALLVAAFSLYIFAKSDKKITRREGISMIFLFLIYYIYLFLQ